MTTDDQIESDSQKKKDDFPELSEGGILKLNKLEPKQHFTMPPPRFSEASLVKELEENGIGRPSTYAAILSTIREKGYVDLVKGYFKPNELGFIVNDLLVKSFPDVLDVEFTANMENDLDRIEAAEVDYSEILRQFYDAFEKELEAASTGMLSVKGIGFPTDLTCPQCNHRLHIRMGRNGQFLGCNNYPSDQPSDKICDKCGKPMLIKDGRYGTFFACSGYPDCKTTLSTNSNGSGEKTGVDCPEQDCNGELVQRSSKRGKIFYGCSRFPDCTFATWDKPVAKECPECGAKFLAEKTTKKQGTFLTSNTKSCGIKATSE